MIFDFFSKFNKEVSVNFLLEHLLSGLLIHFYKIHVFIIGKELTLRYNETKHIQLDVISCYFDYLMLFFSFKISF